MKHCLSPQKAAWTLFAVVQWTPQPPQLLVSRVISVSQPLSGLPSQSMWSVSGHATASGPPSPPPADEDELLASEMSPPADVVEVVIKPADPLVVEVVVELDAPPAPAGADASLPQLAAVNITPAHEAPSTTFQSFTRDLQ